MNKKSFYLLILLLITLTVHHVWFFNTSILTSGDWFAPDPFTLKDYLAPPSAWNVHSFAFGDINIVGYSYPLKVIFGLLARLGFEWNMIERFVFMWPVSLLLVISPFLLIQKVTKSPLSAFVGTIVYSFNTYMSYKQTDNLDLTIGFALLPIMLLIFMRLLEEKKRSLAIITGFLGFILSAYEFRVFYITAWVMFFYLLYYLWKTKQNREKQIQSIVQAAIPICIVLTMNLYWILPLFYTGSIRHNVIFDRAIFGDSFMNITQAITLFHPFWTGTAPTAFEVGPIPLYLFSIPTLAFLGFLVSKKNYYVPFFAFIALLGIFLTKQSGPPFESFYAFAYKSIPGFNAFREASKFYALIALGYSVLIAALIQHIEKTRPQFITRLAVLAISSLFLINTFGFITGSAQTIFVSRSVPKEYTEINEFIQFDPGFFRVLWVPTASRFSIFTSRHPAVSFADIIQTEWAKTVGYRQKDYRISKEELMSFFEKKEFLNLLKQSSIQYIVVPFGSKKNADMIYDNFDNDRKYFIDILDKTGELEKVVGDSNTPAIYEIRTAKPHIYTSERKDSLIEDQEYERVSYKRVGLGKYQVYFSNLKNPVFLHLTEKFHPQWKLKINGKVLPDSQHAQTEAGYNVFLIEPDKEHPQREIFIDIYFNLQKHTDWGLFIGSVTFLICVIIIIREYAENKKK